MDPRLLEILRRIFGGSINPENLLSDFRYVPQGSTPPPGFTHTIKLAAIENQQDVVFAVKFTPEVTNVLNLALAFI